MASLPDSALVPSAEREHGIEKTDEPRRLKNARNRKFESISLRHGVCCEPEFFRSGPRSSQERPAICTRAHADRGGAGVEQLGEGKPGNAIGTVPIAIPKASLSERSEIAGAAQRIPATPDRRRSLKREDRIQTSPPPASQPS
jgi:hypothetical protein